MKKKIIIFIFIFVVLVSASSFAFAADIICNSSTPLRGKITNSSGQPLSGVYIKFYQNNIFLKTTQSKADGSYSFPYDAFGGIAANNLSNSIWSASFDKTGFDINQVTKYNHCSNNNVVLIINTSPTIPPGTNPKCRGSRTPDYECGNDYDCQSATDGCTVCDTTIKRCIIPIPTPTLPQIKNDPCGGAKDAAKVSCLACLSSDPKKTPPVFDKIGSKSWTALGCVSTDPDKFVGQVLPGTIGVGGGIAFLIMLFGIFTIIMSSGNPEKLNQGKEMIVSAIAGLLMILFSVFLLRVIGVNILGIPGLG